MKKQIYIGAESFERIMESNYFYIDKTLFIKELLEKKGMVTLITRPRRFGKTLNMSMLRSFFDIQKNSQPLFEGLAIMEHKDICDRHLNQYPVVSFTLKSVDDRTYDSALNSISNLVAEIYRENMYLLESSSLDEIEKKEFYDYRTKGVTESDLKSALLFLSSCLYAHHQKRVIILLDEYDTPIDSSERYGYYDEMINFMRGFMGNAFKTNDYLEFAVLTGVQRISKEGLFSSFNNLKVRGILDKDFATSFGFTEAEVKAACDMYEISEKYSEIKSWYDGYRFGEQDMYNP